MDNDPVVVSWCGEISKVPFAVRLFLNNVTNSYISHGEIQCGRALNSRKWSAQLTKVLRLEFVDCIKNYKSKQLSKWLALAWFKRCMCGLAVVSFQKESRPFFATIEDLVVIRENRHNGFGGAILSWIEEEVRRHDIDLIFLESGLRNQGAHHFFEKNQYRPLSKVMVKVCSKKKGIRK